ncbi:MAG: hypothetical protein C0609_03515 [Deltaproteobacteria bacterium]|mgnify:CR=1 FL=1|nr:MAG: hypothetical protein C0609_03515 [Deltaproteobacteria bacterium]
MNIDFIIFISLMVIGYTAGSIAERRHFKSLTRREDATLRQPVVTFDEGYELPSGAKYRRAALVSGSAVVSIDYFKRFLASLRFLVGGRVGAYESLLDRARREAILRMKYQAGGASIIMGMRVETSTIGGRRKNNKGLGSVEAVAYGTAVWVDEVSPQIT